MKNGYHGKILNVDLTNWTLTSEEPPDDLYRKYLGGSALNLYYLLKRMPAGVNPLSPDNILTFSVGVTTGSGVSGQSRLCVSAKSPLTDVIGDSQCGGSFPVKFKWSGFDGIIISGKAEKPVYLFIDNGKAELRDASHLWGKITGETELLIRQELADDKIEIASIGPAGENQVLFAAIMNMSNRANGRTGMGAVMGSKNLKAIAVRGNIKPPFHDKAALTALARWGAKALPEAMVKGLAKFGTANAVSNLQAQGGLPTKNFASGSFDRADNISGVTMFEKYLVGAKEGKQERKGRDTCNSCVIRCKRVVKIQDGPHKVDPLYGGPEYETCATFGSYCLVDNLPAIAKANEICNKVGQDTIACGATIAWAMDCFEAGLLTTEDTGGIDIRFGDAETMLKLVQMIADREGFGDILADGSAKAAKRVGRGAELLITCKGSEAPAHMPTSKRSLALIYAVNPFGADHESSEHDAGAELPTFEVFKERQGQLGLTEAQPTKSLGAGKVNYARVTQQFYSFMDSVGLCAFAWGSLWQLYGPAQAVELVQAATGWDFTAEEMLLVGERRINMMRVFNAREGISRNGDVLPEKFFKPLTGGPTEGLAVDRGEFEAALDEYYRQSGWTSDGQPTSQTLDRLGLGWASS